MQAVSQYLSDLKVGLSIKVGGLNVAHGLRLAAEKLYFVTGLVSPDSTDAKQTQDKQTNKS